MLALQVINSPFNEEQVDLLNQLITKTDRATKNLA